MGRLLPAALVLLTALGAADASRAAWQSPGAGGQAAKAITLGTGSTPSASVSNRSVSLTWSATTLPGGGSVSGYTVRRYSSGGVLQSIGSSCSGTITATSCTETGVPGGTWRYTITPVQGNWSGSASAQSSAVTVGAPAVTLNSTTVSSLPATVTGSVANYITAQTATFRLDDPSTGTLLTGTLTPSSVPASGSATFSVTLPSGTSNGTHRIYVVGSAGDAAGADITVAVPTSITTSAWSVSDVSSGTAVDASAQPAFAGDGLTLTTGNWATAFSATRYVEFDSNTTLPAGKAVTGATFNYRRAASAAGDVVCYYLEVRRISTGAVLAAHGDAATPLGCVTGTTLTTTTTPLPEISTTDIANDTRVRVYSRSSGSRATTIDVATITGTAGTTPFTLYTRNYIDTAAGGASTTYPWSQMTVDNTTFDIGSNWPNTSNTTRYLRVAFPAYVPAGAAVTAATLKHAYRPVVTGNTACWYAELYSAGALIATYGSSATPVGCNSGPGFVTDSLPLTAVNTAARANDVTVRLIFSASGGNRRTQHDLTELALTYVE
ncbi:MAG TPA: hypothetical protein VF712_00775 [Thermoleophilaceae bacterium]|jgi:hypothetical protein